MIFCIPCLDYDTSQSAATIERRIPDTRYTFRNCYTRQSAAIIESITTDTRYAVWNNYSYQTAATPERRISDTRYTIWDSDTYQPAATFESATTDTRTACYNYFFQIFRNIIVVITIRTRTEYIPEMRFSAAIRFFTHTRYGDTNQPAATFESATTDTCYAVGYNNTRQSAATGKRVIKYTYNSVRDSNIALQISGYMNKFRIFSAV